MNLNEIEKEIERLEQMETTYDVCFKLASLYTIRDHQSRSERRTAEHSFSRSEFYNAMYDAPFDEAMEILDEHMECIKLLHNKEYSAIINRLKSI